MANVNCCSARLRRLTFVQVHRCVQRLKSGEDVREAWVDWVDCFGKSLQFSVFLGAVIVICNTMSICTWIGLVNQRLIGLQGHSRAFPFTIATGLPPKGPQHQADFLRCSSGKPMKKSLKPTDWELAEGRNSKSLNQQQHTLDSLAEYLFLVGFSIRLHPKWVFLGPFFGSEINTRPNMS